MSGELTVATPLADAGELGSDELTIEQLRARPEYELGLRLAAATISSLMGDKHVDTRLKRLRRMEATRTIGGPWVALALVAHAIAGRAFGGPPEAEDYTAVEAMTVIKDYLLLDHPRVMHWRTPCAAD